MRIAERVVVVTGLLGLLWIAGPGSMAGSHTWDVWEVFTNADGTVQFIKLHEANGTNFETGLGGHLIVANPTGSVYSIQNSVAAPTANRFYLLATTGFAALPGAPTPDEIIPDNFITIAADTEVVYDPWDNATWSPGVLPTDGVSSLRRTGPSASDLTPATNCPRNYAGATGTINAPGGGPLPGVPDELTGSPTLVSKLTANGSSLSISWDPCSCSDGNDHQILFGQKTDFPASPGGTYNLQGGKCDIGSVSPFTWTATPSATDGRGLIWFLVVSENNAGTEGPWGKYNGSNERNGPGLNGSSNVCGATNRDLASTCGH